LRFSTHIAVFSATVRDRPGPWLLRSVNTKSYVADQSVSVSMTLSDLERRDERVKFFRRNYVSFDRERSNL